MGDKKLIKVLIIDDEKSIRKSLQRALINLGYTCFEADSGITALKMFEIEPVDLVITDIVMPEMDGIETIRRLKEKDPDIAAVVMTGYGTVENSVSAMKIGVSDFLTKPMDLEVLPYVVEAAIEKRKLIIENREYQKTLEKQVEERTRYLSLSLQDLKRNFTDTIRAFTGLMEQRDIHIGSHSKRVAVACRGICKRYNLSENVHHDIEIGSLLHDIGKIAIPDEILKKTANFFTRSKIDPKDEKIIRQHPIIGQNTIEQIEILRSMGAIVRHHHEYFNGSGYPDGLSGDAIPFGSRIICVADAYDNIVNTVEEKRRNIAHTIAVKILRKKAGELYDPDVVDSFLEYIEETLVQKRSTQEFRSSVDELQPGMILARDLYMGNDLMLVPQYEKLDDVIIDRIKRFNRKKPLDGRIYIYESSSELLAEKSRDKKKKPVKSDAPSDVLEISFQKVKEKIDATSDLQILPIIYHSAMALLSDPLSTKSDLVTLLKTDQVIVTKILRIVNSALFGFARKVTIIDDAIPLLGLNEIRSIVISVSVISVFNKREFGVFDRSEFWKHSLACAIISKLLAKRIKISSPDEFFTAGFSMI